MIRSKALRPHEVVLASIWRINDSIEEIKPLTEVDEPLRFFLTGLARIRSHILTTELTLRRHLAGEVDAEEVEAALEMASRYSFVVDAAFFAGAGPVEETLEKVTKLRNGK